MKLLDEISEIVELNIKNHPILKELKLLIFNKKLDWYEYVPF